MDHSRSASTGFFGVLVRLPGRRRGLAALVASGLALTFATIGCASTTNVDDGVAAAVGADLIDVYEQINGNVRQRGASEVLTYVAYQEPIKKCMSAAGYSYSPPLFYESYRGVARVTLPTGVSAIVEPGAESVLAQLVNSLEAAAAVPEHRNPGFETLPEDQRQLYLAKVESCEPPTDTYVDRFKPAAAGAVSGRFHDMLEDVGRGEKVAAAMESYPACMAKQGVPVQDLNELQSSVRQRFIGPDGQPIGPRSTAWPSAVTYQQSAVAADKSCRVPAWRAAMTRLDQLLPAFVETNEAQLATIDGEWQAIEDAAEQARAKLPL
ncbi:hypothetical protein [Micromonospora echinofusca]|uniref:Lipoprotein n=1 Tax=Micromonospora echinofusca TaxID=47858 RepID=A0ABS3VV96_MICEH|nr:hypothetical protein [Micromonospora echinofusca]MBO4208467.1 hypothetical protein [Micromonospora echinofusca]